MEDVGGGTYKEIVQMFWTKLGASLTYRHTYSFEEEYCRLSSAEFHLKGEKIDHMWWFQQCKRNSCLTGSYLAEES